MDKIHYLTVQQYAEKYDKHPNTIYRWIEEEKIDARKDPGGHGWLIIMNGTEKHLPDES